MTKLLLPISKNCYFPLPQKPTEVISNNNWLHDKTEGGLTQNNK